MYNRNIKEAIDFPRLHHQWLPMRVDAEVGFSKVKQTIHRPIDLNNENNAIIYLFYRKQ